MMAGHIRVTQPRLVVSIKEELRRHTEIRICRIYEKIAIPKISVEVGVVKGRSHPKLPLERFFTMAVTGNPCRKDNPDASAVRYNYWVIAGYANPFNTGGCTICVGPPFAAI